MKINKAAKKAVKELAALAQESRLAIFRLLVEAGKEGLSVGTIAEKLKIPNATLSFHLKELVNAELIAGIHQGRFIYYAVQFSNMNALVQYLTDNCCNGITCEITKEECC